MRPFVLIVFAALAVLLAACERLPKAGASATSFKVDKVSPKDGPIASDGAMDAAVELAIEGAISALLVMSVDEKTGSPAHGQQWDTFVGEEVIPPAVRSTFATGSTTWQLGVFTGGAPRTNAAGSLEPLGEGAHELTLHLSESESMRTLRYRAVAVRPDGSVVRSNVFSF